MANSYLKTYLNDHLGGSQAGVDLARRGASEHEGTELGKTFAELAEEIEQDREVLRRAMDSLGVPQQRYKRVIAGLGERLGRAKSNGKIFGDSPLSPLIEIEGLSLGIEGKEGLWRTLAGAGIRPDGVDLAEMEERARSQRQRLERHRSEIAAKAFGAEG
jgi:hypothetical protein